MKSSQYRLVRWTKKSWHRAVERCLEFPSFVFQITNDCMLSANPESCSMYNCYSNLFDRYMKYEESQKSALVPAGFRIWPICAAYCNSIPYPGQIQPVQGQRQRRKEIGDLVGVRNFRVQQCAHAALAAMRPVSLTRISRSSYPNSRLASPFVPCPPSPCPCTVR